MQKILSQEKLGPLIGGIIIDKDFEKSETKLQTIDSEK